MARDLYFITHPNVIIDPTVAVPRWQLSRLGRERMRAGLKQPWLSGLSALYASAERKARDAAEILAQDVRLPVQICADLGEIDRSATGYLPHAEHEAVTDAMFSAPDVSARGWETARAAQARIVRAVEQLLARDSTPGAVAIVSHGAVGALLLCHLTGQPIHRQHDQPGSGGGNYFHAQLPPPGLVHGWRAFDA